MKYTKLLLSVLINFVFFVLFFPSPTSAQAAPPDFAWAREITINAAASLDGGQAVVVDSQDNIIATGQIDGDFEIAKYSPTGNLLWSEQISATNLDDALGLTVDVSGNIYVTGSFQSTITFAAGQANELSLTSAGGQDVFVAKYDLNGSLLWATSAGGASSIYGEDIIIDASGNPLIIGDFSQTATFGQGEPNQTVLVSAGGKDIFVAKLNAATGELIWAKQIGGIANDQGTSIEADVSDGFVVAGGFSDTVVFGAGETNETTLQAGLDTNLFIAKYDDQTDLVWAKQATGNFVISSAPSLALFVSGDVFVFTSYIDTVTFAPGEPNEVSLTNIGPLDSALAKYDNQGQLSWVKSMTGGSHVNAFDVTVDSLGNSTVGGSFLNNLIINSGEPDELILTGRLNSHNSYIVQYSSVGDFVFAKQIDSGTTGFSLIRGIAHDAADNIAMSGVFGGPVVFDNDTLTSSHGMFTAKLGDAPISPQREPVILVPGLPGSELWHEGEEIWMNILNMIFDFDDDFLDVLSMDGLGNSINNIEVGDIIRSKTGIEIWNNLITDFENAGYEENEDLFIFPYDWRLNNSTTAELLGDEIQSILQSTEAEKVDLVMHSNGGLVTKQYINENGEDKIDQLIFMGTPHYGATKSFKTLLFGDDFGVPFGTLNPSALFRISQDMLSVYQLLPSMDFFNEYDHYFNDINDVDSNGVVGFLDFDETQDLIENFGLNVILRDNANDFHESLDDWVASPEMQGRTHNIVGCAKPTLGRIIYGVNPLTGADTYLPENVDGDETVPLQSALGVTSGSTYYIPEAKHSRMPDNIHIRNLVFDILDDNNVDLGETKYDDIRDGLSGCGFEYIEQSVHSPLEIHAYDEFGNHTGPNDQGGIDEEIPGTIYEIFGEDKFLYYPSNPGISVTLIGTDVGVFDYHINEITEAGTEESARFFELPVTPSTTGEVIFDGLNLDQALIRLDHDDDGTIDEEFSPTSILDDIEAQDYIPPTTDIVVTGTLGTNDWYTSGVEITLTAIDDIDGSGVLETRYSLDNGQTWNIYTGPIDISDEGEHTLQYFSFDLAGNGEQVKEELIKIDFTPPEFEIIYDTELKDIVFTSVDAEVVCNIDSCTATDEAGNYTKINFSQQSLTNDPQYQYIVILQSIEYNGVEHEFENNRFLIRAKYETTGTIIKQEFKTDITKVNANYNSIDDTTLVQWMIRGQVGQKEEHQGLKLIHVLTNDSLISWELL
jgi:pimeloyl-ACP methyl ester carboxylesterase